MVYPFDLYTIGDWAYAVRRSIHVYDVIPTYYDYAYAVRRNVVHAYDVIPQPDTANRSGNVTLSVTDIISIPEWFFRVNKALKIFEVYIPFELATASAVPTIYADDLFIIYDLGASVNAIKATSAFDKLIADFMSYTKSYSPLLFTLFQRKVPIVYKTLSVLDTVAISERIDYVKSYSPLLFTLFQRKVPIVYKSLGVLDIVAVKDGLSTAVAKSVSAYDHIMYDYVPSMNPSSVHFMSIYPNPTTYGTLVSDYGILYDSAVAVRPYKPVVVLDVIGVKDGVSISKRSVVAYDKLVADSVALNKV